MIITEFCEEDRRSFYELEKCFYAVQATLRGYDESMTERTFRRVLDRLGNLWGFMLRTERDAEPFGYALVTSYWSNEEGGEMVVLDEIYLSPESQHHGYATEFMKWLEVRFSNAAALTLEVLAKNTHAQEFYSKLKFRPDGFISYVKSLHTAQ